MRISNWSSDVFASDLQDAKAVLHEKLAQLRAVIGVIQAAIGQHAVEIERQQPDGPESGDQIGIENLGHRTQSPCDREINGEAGRRASRDAASSAGVQGLVRRSSRSEEHTTELQ